MGRYFGTDGFRGEAGTVLTIKKACKIGGFLGWYYNRKRREEGKTSPAKIVIGKDTRRSGYMLEYALASAIAASGADAYLLHVTTTPSVSYITRVDGFDCGIMISASHNPYTDNGIKLFSSDGEKAEDGVISLIEDYLDDIPVSGETQLPYATGSAVGRVVDYIVGRSRYIAYLNSIGAHSIKGKRVGIDAANGSAWYIAKAVFETLGAEVHIINNSPDGLNINRNCGSTHTEGLVKLVKENSLDIGFAYDGDADRCVCVDEKGNVVDGDKIMYVCALYLKERGELSPDEVVTTVMSNSGLYKALKNVGIGYAETAVGDKNVREYMAAHGNVIGGEQSGHIIFSKYATTGDGILTGLMVMEAIIAKNAPLSVLAEPVKLFPQTLINIKVTDKDAALSDSGVRSAIKDAENELGGNGRILVRASGTEPVIRIMSEAEDEALCARLAEGIAKAVKCTDYFAGE